jgi:two-component system, sensor histidine kinase and response regulator
MNKQKVPPTLLLIDDMAESRNGFNALFEQGGYRVVTAHDEENAAIVSRILPPDLILICSVIPPSDYFEVASRISYFCSHRSDVPVVFFADQASEVVSEGGEVSIGPNVYAILPDDFIQLESFLSRLQGALERAA